MTSIATDPSILASPPSVIRAGTADELLALVPALAGAEPRRSLVCVAFRGTRTIGVLRHELPHRLADHQPVVQAVIAMLCRIDGADSVVPIVYTDRDYPRGSGAAELRLLARCVDRLEEAGFAVRDSLLVAATGWGSQLDRRRPRDGRPLAEIEVAAARLADALPPSDGLDDWTARTFLSAEVAAALRDLDVGAASSAESEREPCEAVDPIELVESLLACDTAPEAASLARLARLASLAAYRDAMILQIAFGAAVGELALDGSLVANSRAAAAEVTLDELVQGDLETGSVDEIDELIGRMFLGETRLRPEAQRVRRGIRVVEFAARHCPPALRPGLLCIEAWLHWSLGLASRAGERLDRALEIEPGHPMALLLAGYFSHGVLPEWAFVPPEPR
ncbi:DUF4192 family protein [Agromyces soli]